MESPLVLFLSGPAASGKTTVAQAWANREGDPRAWIGCDLLRSLVRSGRPHPDERWDDETERYWWLAARQAADLAQSFTGEGISCVIEAYAPPSEHDRWAELLRPLPAVRVDLVPSLEACRQRNADRTSHRLSEESLVQNYSDYDWCITRFPPPHVVDTTSMTEVDTVRRVEEILDLERPRTQRITKSYT